MIQVDIQHEHDWDTLDMLILCLRLRIDGWTRNRVIFMSLVITSSCRGLVMVVLCLGCLDGGMFLGSGVLMCFCCM